MVMRPLTKRDREIKAMILRGMSPTVIAQNKGMTRSALYKVIDKLIFRKELYVIPGTNPRCYVDANPEDSQIPEKETNGPTVEKDGPPPSGFSGISFAEKCPSGDEWWEAHMTSGIKFTVAHEGDFTDPRDRNGFYIGFWKKEEPTKMNGARVRVGGMKMHGQDVSWQVRIGMKNHKLTFFFYPGRIFVDITKYPTEDLLVPIFKDRALQFASIMERSGWKLTNPIVKGTIHRAKPGHRAIQHFDKDAKQFSQPDLIVDTSDGEPELEFENLEKDPLSREKQEVMAFLPSRILAAEAEIDSHSVCISDLMCRLDSTLTLLDKLVEGQEKLTFTGSVYDRNGTEVSVSDTSFIPVVYMKDYILTEGRNEFSEGAGILIGVQTGSIYHLTSGSYFTVDEGGITYDGKATESVTLHVKGVEEIGIHDLNKPQDPEVPQTYEGSVLFMVIVVEFAIIVGLLGIIVRNPIAIIVAVVIAVLGIVFSPVIADVVLGWLG